jgi:RNA polymerase sigma-70 factor (ECF subfamily)
VSLFLTDGEGGGHCLDVNVAATTRGDAVSHQLVQGVRPRFEEIYRAELGFVWRGVRGLGVGEEAVDDVVQEIFMTAHRTLARFEGRSSVRTWLSGIMLNVVRHHRRSRVRRHAYEGAGHSETEVESLPATGTDPHELALAREQTRLLERILDELDDKKREILVLAELEELSAGEIGEILGLGLNSVYSRLRLARADFAQAAARYRARAKRETGGTLE